jgi:hypothetical protein
MLTAQVSADVRAHVVKVGRIDQLDDGKILVYSGDGACFKVDAFAGTVALKERDAASFTTIFQGPSKYDRRRAVAKMPPPPKAQAASNGAITTSAPTTKAPLILSG